MTRKGEKTNFLRAQIMKAIGRGLKQVEMLKNDKKKMKIYNRIRVNENNRKKTYDFFVGLNGAGLPPLLCVGYKFALVKAFSSK